MKLIRESHEVVLRMSYEEARELKKHLETIGWHRPVTKELLSEIGTLFGENNE